MFHNSSDICIKSVKRINTCRCDPSKALCILYRHGSFHFAYSCMKVKHTGKMRKLYFKIFRMNIRVVLNEVCVQIPKNNVFVPHGWDSGELPRYRLREFVPTPHTGPLELVTVS